MHLEHGKIISSHATTLPQADVITLTPFPTSHIKTPSQRDASLCLAHFYSSRLAFARN